MSQPTSHDLPARLRALRSKIKIWGYQQRSTFYLNDLQACIRTGDHHRASGGADTGSLEVDRSHISADAEDIRLKFGAAAQEGLELVVGPEFLAQAAQIRRECLMVLHPEDLSMRKTVKVSRSIQEEAVTLRGKVETLLSQHRIDLCGIRSLSIVSQPAALNELETRLDAGIEAILSEAETLVMREDVSVPAFIVLATHFREVGGAHLTAKAELEREMKAAAEKRLHDLKIKKEEKEALIEELEMHTRQAKAARDGLVAEIEDVTRQVGV